MSEAKRHAHEAIGGLLNDDEFAMGWVLIIDVAGSDGARCLAHYAGSGADGTDIPLTWDILGMLRSGTLIAENRVLGNTFGPDDDDDDA